MGAYARLQEVRNKRTTELEEARAILDEAAMAKRDLTKSEKSRFEAIHKAAGKATEEIGRLERQADAERNLPAQPISSPEQRDQHRFIDPRTGREIRSFGPGESVAEHYRSQGDRLGVTVGAWLYAAAFGARNDAERRALSIVPDASGGYGVPRPLWGEMMDALRPLSRVLSAGARIFPMTAQTLRIAKIDTDPVPAWRAEAAPLAESDPGFGALDLVAKDLAVYTKVSRELAADAPNLDLALEKAFLGAMAAAMDQAYLEGDGTNNTPTGLRNISGLTEVDKGNADIEWDAFINLQAALYDQNSYVEMENAVVANTDWATLVSQKDTSGQYILPTAYVAKLNLMPTSQIATGPSTAYGGDWSQYAIGMREEANVRLLVERYADTGQIGIIAHARTDCGMVHPASMGRIINLGAIA